MVGPPALGTLAAGWGGTIGGPRALPLAAPGGQGTAPRAMAPCPTLLARFCLASRRRGRCSCGGGPAGPRGSAGVRPHGVWRARRTRGDPGGARRPRHGEPGRAPAWATCPWSRGTSTRCPRCDERAPPASAATRRPGSGWSVHRTGGGRWRPPHPGPGAARRASSDAGGGPRRCAAWFDRRRSSVADRHPGPLGAVAAPGAAPGPRPQAQAAVGTAARAALGPRGAVVPAPAPRGRPTPRGVRLSPGHGRGLGTRWLEPQDGLWGAAPPRQPPGRRGARAPGEHALPGQRRRAGAAGVLPDLPPLCLAPRQRTPAPAAP